MVILIQPNNGFLLEHSSINIPHFDRLVIVIVWCTYNYDLLYIVTIAKSQHACANCIILCKSIKVKCYYISERPKRLLLIYYGWI